MDAAVFCWAIAVWSILLTGGQFQIADACLLVSIGFMEERK